MKTILTLLVLVFVSINCNSQENAVQTGKQILTYLQKKDSLNLSKLVDKDFISVQADGLIQDKTAFINAYRMFGKSDNLLLSSQVNRIIQKGDITILNGVLTQQWEEGPNTVRQKIPFTDTYRREGSKWILLSSFFDLFLIRCEFECRHYFLFI